MNNKTKKTKCECEGCKAIEVVVKKITKTLAIRMENKDGKTILSDVVKVPTEFSINTKTHDIKVKKYIIKLVPRIVIGFEEK